MNRVVPLLSPCRMCEKYESGMTLKQIAKLSGVCSVTVLNILRKTNCRMRKSGIPKGSKLPREWIEHSAASRRGGTKPDSMKKKLSEAKKCHYNGFNGCGHLKQHASGYVQVYVPDHPHATADGYVFLHTVVMERAIGRYLDRDEVVHHINHIKNDNRLENLALMNRHEHHSMHMKERMAKRRNDLLTV